jgi:hypothetical protein
MNPFDIKSALLARHAQHVVLIHFPIALFIAGVAFDAVAVWTRRRGFADAAYYNLLVAAISTVPAIATGILAWQWDFADAHGDGGGLDGDRLDGVVDAVAGADGAGAEDCVADRGGTLGSGCDRVDGASGWIFERGECAGVTRRGLPVTGARTADRGVEAGNLEFRARHAPF